MASSAVTTTTTATTKTITSGNGNDTISVADLNKNLIINSGSGNDKITVDDIHGNVDVNAGAGNDQVKITDVVGLVDVDLGAGNDKLTLDDIHGAVVVDLGAGNDEASISDVTGNVSVTGGSGNDCISIDDVSGSVVVATGAGNDTISITDVTQNVNVNSAGGNDALLIYDVGGNAIVTAGAGNDAMLVAKVHGSVSVSSGAGNDDILSFDVTGAASYDAGAGNDALFIYDVHGPVSVIAGEGNDDVFVGAASGLVTVDAGDGNDAVLIQCAAATVLGGKGNDVIVTDDGVDHLFGGAGNDVLYAGMGNDEADGGAGADYIYAQGGNDFASYLVSENIGVVDRYDGGAGSDTLTLHFAQSDLTRLGVTNVATFSAALQSAFGASSSVNFAAFGFNLIAGSFEHLVLDLPGALNFVPVVIGNLQGGSSPNDAVDYHLITGPIVADMGPASVIVHQGSSTGTLTSIENITLTNLNDTINWTGGSYAVNAGAGTDTLNTAGSALAATINLNSGAATLGAATSSFVGVENVATGAGNDTITTNALANIIDAGGGDDTIIGSGLGVGDVWNGGGGVNTYKPVGGETIIGGALGQDTMVIDNLEAGDHVLTLNGLNGTVNSTLIDYILISSVISLAAISAMGSLSVMANSFANGAVVDISSLINNLNDRLDFSGNTSAITANLSSGVVSDGVHVASMRGFENVIGSAQGDTIVTSAVANTINAGGGNDTIIGNGLGVGDVWMGGGGVNTYVPTGGETIIGGALGQDTIVLDNLEAGDHVLTMNGLNGTMNSTAIDYVLISSLIGIAAISTMNSLNVMVNSFANGIVVDISSYVNNFADKLDFSNSATAVNVNLATGIVSDGVNTATMKGFEQVVGSAYGDTLTGSGVQNLITGGLGDDVIDGAGSIDTALFSGNLVNYTLTDMGSFIRVVGPDGTDSLYNMEFIKFGASPVVAINTVVDNLPISIALSDNHFNEDTLGAVVGNIVLNDPDGGALTYAVSDSRFEVVGGVLKLTNSSQIDFETEPTVNINVTATNAGGGSVQQNFVLHADDVAESTLTAGDVYFVIDSNLSDVSFNNEILLSHSAGAGLSIDSLSGVPSGNLSILGPNNYDYMPDQGVAVSETAAFVVRDSALATANALAHFDVQVPVAFFGQGAENGVGAASGADFNAVLSATSANGVHMYGGFGVVGGQGAAEFFSPGGNGGDGYYTMLGSVGDDVMWGGYGLNGGSGGTGNANPGGAGGDSNYIMEGGDGHDVIHVGVVGGMGSVGAGTMGGAAGASNYIVHGGIGNDTIDLGVSLDDQDIGNGHYVISGDAGADVFLLGTDFATPASVSIYGDSAVPSGDVTSLDTLRVDASGLFLDLYTALSGGGNVDLDHIAILDLGNQSTTVWLANSTQMDAMHLQRIDGGATDTVNTVNNWFMDFGNTQTISGNVYQVYNDSFVSPTHSLLIDADIHVIA